MTAWTLDPTDKQAFVSSHLAVAQRFEVFQI